MMSLPNRVSFWPLVWLLISTFCICNFCIIITIVVNGSSEITARRDKHVLTKTRLGRWKPLRSGRRQRAKLSFGECPCLHFLVPTKPWQGKYQSDSEQGHNIESATGILEWHVWGFGLRSLPTERFEQGVTSPAEPVYVVWTDCNTAIGSLGIARITIAPKSWKSFMNHAWSGTYVPWGRKFVITQGLACRRCSQETDD